MSYIDNIGISFADEAGAKKNIAVVGLGYVGLPLAEAFSHYFNVVGFDVSQKHVDRLNAGRNSGFRATTNPSDLKEADFLIIAVPTLITGANEPDMSYVIKASKTISQNMKRGSTVILESTVYPGVTETVLKQILEESGLICGADFKIAYSPERINPGDTAHVLENTTKVVAGIDPETSERVADLYRKVCGKVFIAANIKTAEASKVLENTQRDLNIALINECSIIFNSIGINTNEVLDTASTKWNFIRYSPGLVGGHCIPIVPYFFAHVAKEASYYPKVILAGRETNDYMPKYIAHLVIKGLNSASKMIKSSKVLILGLSYKENIADPRETPIRDTIRELKDFEVELYGYDPLITDIDREFGIIPVVDIERLKGVDCIIMTVGHDIFKSITLKMLRVITGRNPLLVDIRHFYDALEAKKVGFNYKTL